MTFHVGEMSGYICARGKGEVRYTDLTKLIASRGTLSANLKELEKEELVRRRVVTTKPIQTYYVLTEKGQEITKRLSKIKGVLSS